jgi:hypothetical protein
MKTPRGCGASVDRCGSSTGDLYPNDIAPRERRVVVMDMVMQKWAGFILGATISSRTLRVKLEAESILALAIQGAYHCKARR